MEQNETRMDKVVNHMRQFWWGYALYTMSTGILLLFIAGFINDKNISIATMNSWVGIILGLIATILGIISMFLSFYNLDQSIKTQKETLDKIEEIKKEIIENVEKNSKETIKEIQGNQNLEMLYPKKGEWKNVD